MPESVKWVAVHQYIATPTGETGFAFNLKLADDEVMMLLALHYWWSGVLAAGNGSVTLALWRKTDTDPSNVFDEDDSPDMIWSEKHGLKWVTESLVASKARDITFPWPIVLIRPPRAIIGTGLFTAMRVTMRLYYTLREVREEDLARLMVKDHA